MLREEKEKLERRDKGLAVKFKQFQEEMARLQVIGGEALFRQKWEWIGFIDFIDHSQYYHFPPDGATTSWGTRR